MKFARVEDGEVREIINFNPKGKFTKEIEDQFVEVDGNVKVRYKLKNNKFVEPDPEPEVVEGQEPPVDIRDLANRVAALEEVIKTQKGAK